MYIFKRAAFQELLRHTFDHLVAQGHDGKTDDQTAYRFSKSTCEFIASASIRRFVVAGSQRHLPSCAVFRRSAPGHRRPVQTELVPNHRPHGRAGIVALAFRRHDKHMRMTNAGPPFPSHRFRDGQFAVQQMVKRANLLSRAASALADAARRAVGQDTSSREANPLATPA